MSGPPAIQTQKTFTVAQVIGENPDRPALCGSGAACGAGAPAAMLFCLVGLRFMRSRR